MNTTTATTASIWSGAGKPLKSAYGKLMMWFFILSDALTFTGFLVAYGFSRFKYMDTWPIADEVFNHFPFLHGEPKPMYYVALMTFILIFSSVTMVLAVDAGHQMKKKKVTLYMFLTIIGGAIFLGSQAWEWKNFIKGEFGALETKGKQIYQLVEATQKEGKTVYDRVDIRSIAVEQHSDRVQHQSKNGVWYMGEKSLPSVTASEVVAGIKKNHHILIRSQETVPDIESFKQSGDARKIAKAERLERELVNPKAVGEKAVYKRTVGLQKLENVENVVEGANLRHNEYGSPLFGDFFFFITGFHGFHVFSGLILNIIIFVNVLIGTYDRRKDYGMVEKVGLYWHFVDLVWVFVFTFFYLV